MLGVGLGASDSLPPPMVHVVRRNVIPIVIVVLDKAADLLAPGTRLFPDLQFLAVR